jgi:hypothetical protein
MKIRRFLGIAVLIGVPIALDGQPSALPQGLTESYVCTTACKTCHPAIYERWSKTRMANVVRGPKTHPDAMPPDLVKPDTPVKFCKDDIAFVYGSKWKQRYFTKRGDDYYPLGAQWDVTHQIWRAYMVAPSSDWWTAFYPADKASDGSALRRLPFRQLQHRDQNGDGMERRPEATDQVASTSNDFRLEYHQPCPPGLSSGNEHVHRMQGNDFVQSARRKLLQLPRRARNGENCRPIETSQRSLPGVPRPEVAEWSACTYHRSPHASFGLEVRETNAWRATCRRSSNNSPTPTFARTRSSSSGRRTRSC